MQTAAFGFCLVNDGSQSCLARLQTGARMLQLGMDIGNAT